MGNNDSLKKKHQNNISTSTKQNYIDQWKKDHEIHSPKYNFSYCLWWVCYDNLHNTQQKILCFKIIEAFWEFVNRIWVYTN